MFDHLHAYFTEATQHVRERLGEANISAFHLEIQSKGRTLTGEFLTTYILANEYYSDKVAGDTLPAVIDEFLRRKGWETRHAPKALPKPPSDEIGF